MTWVWSVLIAVAFLAASAALAALPEAASTAVFVTFALGAVTYVAHDIIENR